MDIQYPTIDNDEEAICPYCGKGYAPETAAYSEVFANIHACHYCGKNYFQKQIFTVTYNSRPDCQINGLKHQFKKDKFGTSCCTVCGAIQGVSHACA